MLVWRHSTAKHFRFCWWIRVETGFAVNPDSDSRTEWMVSLNPTRIQIRIRQIEYAITSSCRGQGHCQGRGQVWARGSGSESRSGWRWESRWSSESGSGSQFGHESASSCGSRFAVGSRHGHVSGLRAGLTPCPTQMQWLSVLSLFDA